MCISPFISRISDINRRGFICIDEDEFVSNKADIIMRYIFAFYSSIKYLVDYINIHNPLTSARFN